MADNVQSGAAVGVGPIFGADEVAAVFYPRSKQVWGVDGVVTDVAAGAAALPIQDGGNSITIDGSVSITGALPAGTANIGGVDVLTVPAPLSTAGGGTEATALRVTVATDSTGVLSVDDNGASLTVDSPQLPAALTGGGNLKVSLTESTASQAVTGTVAVSSLPALVAGTANIGDVDVLSVVPGTAATNLGKAEDAAHGDGDTGVMSLAVRKDSGATIAGADGDYTPLQVDASGNLRVNIAAGSAAGGTSATDEAAFTAGATAGTPVMGARDDAASDTLAEGVVGIIRATENRALHVNLRDAAGAELAVGGGTQYTEDAAAAANPVGTALNLIRQDALSSLTTTDGDNVAARGTDKGELYVKHVDAIPVTAASLPLPSGASTEATLASALTSVQLLDDAVKTDDAAFTPATDKVLMVGAAFDDDTTDGVDDGDAGALRMSSRRELYSQLRDAAGNERGANVNASNALLVAQTGALPAGANDIGDVTINNAAGAAAVNVQDGGNSLTIDGTVAVSSLPASTNTLEVVGDAAHDAAVSGNPVLIGAEARTTDGTAVASGDVVRPIADTLGKQVVLIGALTDLRVNGKLTEADSTADDIIAAIASTKIVVTSVVVTNGHASVGTKVEIRAGTTVKMQQFAAAAGGGWAVHDAGGLFETAQNEAVTGRCVTTGADVDFFVAGFKRTN